MDSSPLDLTSTKKDVTPRSSPALNSPKQFQVYGTRWVVLSCCALLAMSNTMQWVSYVPINQEVRTFYCANKTDLSCDPCFITNQLFQAVGAITCILGMYITDKHGIRLSLWIAVGCNLIGSGLRLISSITSIEESFTRISLLYTGTAIVSIAQSFFLVLPCKIAQVWFPEDQRATANVLSYLTNPIGDVIGTLVPSLFFDTANADKFERNSTKMFNYNGMIFFLCVIPFVLSFFIRSSEPPTPPSAANSAQEIAPTFWKGILCCLKNVQFYIQMLIVGLSFGLLWGTMVVLPDIFKANGYNLSGYPIVSCAASAVLISFIAARIADKTKKIAEIMKIGAVLFFVCAAGLRVYLHKSVDSGWDSVVVLVLCGLLGGFATLQFSIGTEAGVETTFPVYEATSAGLLVLSTQLWMFLFYYLFEWIKTFNILHDFEANSIEGNWKFVLDVWVGLSLVNAIFSFIFLRPRYKRIEYENEQKSQKMDESTKSATSE